MDSEEIDIIKDHRHIGNRPFVRRRSIGPLPSCFSSGDETVRKVQKEDNSAAVLSAEGDSGAGKMYSSVKIVEVRKSRVGRMFKARNLYSGCGRRRWMNQWPYWKCLAAILHLVREKTGIWICDTNI